MQKKHNEPEMPSSVFVALVGRPNVGKSSLTNHLVGEKVAIVTQKAQTTRNRITGIITKGPVQYVLLDTPGIHKPRNRLDSRMTQTAAASLKDVDVTLMLFEPTGEFTESELGMELMNSAVERAVDKPDTTHWWSAGAAKDMAAGGVLVTAFGAVVVGICLFGNAAALNAIWTSVTATPLSTALWVLSLVLAYLFTFRLGKQEQVKTPKENKTEKK